MASNRRDHRLNSFHSLDLPSSHGHQDDDTVSLRSFNQEVMVGLDQLASHLDTLLRPRGSAHRRLYNSIVQYKGAQRTGWIINGSLFDEQIFQATRSSCIINYANTPHDLNQFLQGHHLKSSSSPLDTHLFKLAFVLTLSDGLIDHELVLASCPQGEMLVDEIHHYKRFCFPELHADHHTPLLDDPSTYIFTRTLSDGQVEYGYCRRLSQEYNRTTKFPVVLCIVSNHSYFKLYDSILNEFVAAYIANEAECALLMLSFYSKPLPVPSANSSGIACILNDRRVFFYICPRDDRLNHDYFVTLLSCLSANHIVQLFQAVLSSKRLLLFSHSLSKLTKCCLALSQLIYPFSWPYSFVSLMPSSWLDDLLDAPGPFIYGCLDETREALPITIDHETLQIDLDRNTVEGHGDHILELPAHLRQTLESSLAYLTRFRLTKSDRSLINIAVSEACLCVLSELFHRLPDYYQRKPGSDEEDRHFSICFNYFKYHDNGIDFQSLSPGERERSVVESKMEQGDNRFDYDFQAEAFLADPSTSPYASFLKDFTQGMIFLKFLDDYQRAVDVDLFSQRLNERRQMADEDRRTNPVMRFRQTFDMLEKQMKHLAKPANPLFSKFKKRFFV